MAHLFVEAFDAGLSPTEATKSVLVAIEGAYAFAARMPTIADMIIVARNASPLAVGLGDDASFIGSDAVALVASDARCVYLKDNDYAVIRPEGAVVFDANGVPVNREEVIVAASQGVVDKGGYRHYMEKEP